VLPGFIATEGFPQSELVENPLTRRIVSTPERAAEAIREAGLGGRAERYVPRPYWLAAALRILTPSLVRRVVGGRGAARMTTTTGADLVERQAPPEPRGEDTASTPPRWEPSGGRSPLPPGGGAAEEQG
jgi:hypothetical protein